MIGYMIYGICANLLDISCSHTSQDIQEEAIKFFKRAIQLDPNLVYAYSLIGHELVSMEKYEKVPSAQRYSLQLMKTYDLVNFFNAAVGTCTSTVEP